MEVLFMLLLGCKPKGRLTEQHDVFFTVADSIITTESDVRAFWPEATKIHIDAWREVKYVDEYIIHVVPKEKEKGPYEMDLKLFFLNLGGYRKNEFDEFHYKMLVVAKNVSEAIAIAKSTAFFELSQSHIDDKYGIDVDDAYEVMDILPEKIKEKYRVLILKSSDMPEMEEDKIHLGYQRYEKMKKE
jgi:hypothetical protein